MSKYGTKNDESLTFQLPSGLKDWLFRTAQAAGMSASGFCRALIIKAYNDDIKRGDRR